MNSNQLKHWKRGDMTLGKLRRWHMGCVNTYRAKATDKRASRHTVEHYNALADFHMKAVQALNDLFKPGDNDHLDERL